MSTQLPAKDPNNIEPYFVVWCDIDGTNDGSALDDGELQGATIASVAWIIPSGITKDSDNTDAVTIKGVSYDDDTVATIWLSGGTDKTNYILTCRIETSDSRTLDKAIEIPVRNNI
jgi:hypothetical protein